MFQQRGAGEIVGGVVDTDGGHLAGVVLANQQCGMAGIVDVHQGVLTSIQVVEDSTVGLCKLLRLFLLLLLCIFGWLRFLRRVLLWIRGGIVLGGAARAESERRGAYQRRYGIWAADGVSGEVSANDCHGVILQEVSSVRPGVVWPGVMWCG